MRHSPASMSRASAAAAATASTPFGGMDPAEKRGGSRDPDQRRTGEQRWPHRPRAACLLPLPEGSGWGGGRARATAVLGPRPALPFSPSGEREGSGNRTPGRRRPRGRQPPLCARGRRGSGRGGAAAAGHEPPAVRARAAGVRRAPLAAAAAAAAAAPAAATKRGLGSAQLLSNYPSTDLAAT